MKHVRRNQRATRRRARKAPLMWALAFASAAVLFAVVFTTGTETMAAAPAVGAQDGQAAEAKQKRYRGTRRIVVDGQSGEPRVPTETEVAELVATLSTLTKRTTDAAPTAAAGGAVTVDLEGGFAGVMLARANEDGTYETLCVFTFEEGAEFLGLVEVQ